MAVKQKSKKKGSRPGYYRPEGLKIGIRKIKKKRKPKSPERIKQLQARRERREQKLKEEREHHYIKQARKSSRKKKRKVYSFGKSTSIRAYSGGGGPGTGKRR